MTTLPVVESRLVNQSERQNAIRSRLDALGACSFPDLAKLLGVSEMTIRRDVEKLSQRGELIKTFGGVQSIRGPKHYYESPLQQRLSLHRHEKELIAREAIELIKPQQTVFLDGSTTCLVLARQLAAIRHRLTVVTHSAMTCMELGAAAEHITVGLGGQIVARRHIATRIAAGAGSGAHRSLEIQPRSTRRPCLRPTHPRVESS